MIAFIAVAVAQSWTSVLLEPDTGTTIPVAVAVRQWPATDQVFFAIEIRETGALSENEHLLEVHEFTCGNAPCSTVTLTDGPDVLDGVLRGGQFMNTSMGIHRETATAPITLSLVRRSVVEDDCDADGLNYDTEGIGDTNVRNLAIRRWGWDTSVGANFPTIIQSTPGNTICEDAGLSYTRVLTPGHVTHAAYRWNVNPDINALDRIEYWNGVSNITVPNTNPGGGQTEQDHVTFDFYDNSKRVIAHRSWETVGGVLRSVIRVQFLDEPAPAPDIRFVGDFVSDYPSIVYDNNRFHLVWHDQQATTAGRVRYATCTRAGASTCLNVSDWAVELVDTGTDLQHASVEVDGNKVFIVYMDDIDPMPDKDYRVRAKTQCFGAAAWSSVTEVTPRSPANAEWAQSLFMGRPNFAVNRLDNVFHLAMVEQLQYLPTNDDAEAWWVRTTYSDCP